MSEDIKVLLPKLGESIHSATIVQWFKKIGDPVHLDEPLLEVSTDKVNSEIPSPVAGVLKEIHAALNQELQVGELIAIIATAQTQHIPNTPSPAAQHTTQTAQSEEMKHFFSPALLRIAREQGIDFKELEKIPGTGMGGRLTKNDLESYTEKKSSSTKPCPYAAKPTISASAATDVERLKMTGMRKAIADNMVRSFYEAPHATLVSEVDATRVLKLIQEKKEEVYAKHGVKLTITAFIAKALCKALIDYPLLNSSLENDTILVKRYIHLGIAVSVENGLMVPVIKNCHHLRVAAIAQAIGELSTKARLGTLALDDVAEGTITLTNFGMSGVQIGIPIIRHGEVAIIGAGAVCKKVVPLESDMLAIRSMMHISLTFDHRVLDGMYGCGFFSALKKYFEEEVNIDGQF